jgi:hypothetical protein
LNDTLLFPIVADRLARGVNCAAQDVVCRGNPAPERPEDFLFGYDAVSSSDQVEEQIEYLGLDVEIRSIAA